MTSLVYIDISWMLHVSRLTGFTLSMAGNEFGCNSCTVINISLRDASQQIALSIMKHLPLSMYSILVTVTIIYLNLLHSPSTEPSSPNIQSQTASCILMVYHCRWHACLTPYFAYTLCFFTALSSTFS